MSCGYSEATFCGGWSPWRNVGPKEINICNELRAEAERMINEDFTAYTPLNYRLQVIAGMNYEFKVQVGHNQIAVLTVFQPIYKQPELQHVSVKRCSVGI